MSEQSPSNPQSQARYPQPFNLARITVVERVYHQCLNGEPTSADSSFSRQLESDEQPYSRHCKATKDWKPIDKGWVDKASMVVIKNEGTEILEVGISNNPNALPVFVVLPGESMRGTPVSINSLYIRIATPSNCSTKYQVTMFPA